MATYLPGSTDVFPRQPNFKPDWNRVERGLMLRSSAYAEGARKVKSVYDSVFQSPLMRDGNIERRDTYIKEISESLKNASTMDLSLVQNQEYALNLFEPLQNDKDIIKDILWTKSYYQTASDAEQMRTSSNPETRRQYWDTGMKYLQYQAEEFKNADRATALSMNTPKYIPNVDLTGVATKMYKEMGISVKQDVRDGGYIWTKKNGDIAVPLTQSMVNTLFASDPAIKDMMRAEAYVQRRDFMKANAAVYGSEQAAEREYLKEIYSQLGKVQKDQVVADSQEVKDLRARKDSWEKVITTRGIIPGSDEHKKYMEDAAKLQAAEEAAENSRNESTVLNTADLTNIDDLRTAVDNAVIFASYTDKADKIARLLAYKDAESIAKADPQYMAKLNSQLALNRSITLENLREYNKVLFMDEQIKRGIKPNSSNKPETEKEKKERNQKEQQQNGADEVNKPVGGEDDGLATHNVNGGDQ
jgi:hypothetical protein